MKFLVKRIELSIVTAKIHLYIINYMIPHIIHYIWLGGGIPKEIQYYQSSWKKLEVNGWKIVKHDESSFQLSDLPQSIQVAYKNRKYAIVTDYLRLKILFEYGGVYLDTDVEIRKDFSNLLDSSSIVLGFIFKYSLGTAFIACEKNNCLIKAILDQYQSATYDFDSFSNKFTLTFSFLHDFPMINNNDLFTAFFLKNVPNFKLNGKLQHCGKYNEITIYPKEYLEGYSINPRNDYTIHHCMNSWTLKAKESKIKRELKKYYFFRLLNDIYKRNTKKNLPFKNYVVK